MHTRATCLWINGSVVILLTSGMAFKGFSLMHPAPPLESPTLARDSLLEGGTVAK